MPGKVFWSIVFICLTGLSAAFDTARATSPRRIDYQCLIISGVGVDFKINKAPPAESCLEPDLKDLLQKSAWPAIEEKIKTGLLNLSPDESICLTPLMTAAQKNPDPRVIREIVNRGGEVNKIDSQGFSALDYAARDNPQPLIVRELIDQGANLVKRISLAGGYRENFLSYHDYSPLTLALAHNPEPGVAAELIARGFSVREIDQAGNSPLHNYLEKQGYGEGGLTKAALLIEAGADLTQTNFSGFRPLTVAILRQNLELARFLIEKNPDLAYVDHFYFQGDIPVSYTPLIASVLDTTENGATEMLKMLLELGADPNQPNREGARPLDVLMIFVPNEEAARFLLDKGARSSDVTIPDKYGYPYYGLLGSAILAGFSFETIERLLEGGARVNYPQPHGSSPLFNAVRAESPELVDLLVRYKAEVNVINEYGQTPLWNSVYEARSVEMVRILLAAGADPNVEYGRAEEGHMLPYLAEVCTQLNCADQNYNALFTTLLTEARDLDLDARWCGGGFITTAEGYVKERMLTALHTLTEANCHELAKLLIEKGARTDLRDDEGRTPLDLAVENEFSEMIGLLSDQRSGR